MRGFKIIFLSVILISLLGTNLQSVAASKPAKTKIVSIANSNNTNKIKLKKVSGVKGYKIYRSTNKKTYKLIKTTSSTTYTDKKLIKNKTYYYKVRTYKIAKGKYSYSSYSSVVKKVNSKKVYVTPTGKRYHYNNTCNGGKYVASNLKEAKSRGLTPCQKCVL